MPTVLTLQKLVAEPSFADSGTMFGSAISTICPTQNANDGNAPFEME
jgi:hypothetical protein